MRVAALPFESWSGNIDFYKGLVISNLQRRGVATLFTLGYLPHFSRRTVEDAVSSKGLSEKFLSLQIGHLVCLPEQSEGSRTKI